MPIRVIRAVAVPVLLMCVLLTVTTTRCPAQSATTSTSPKSLAAAPEPLPPAQVAPTLCTAEKPVGILDCLVRAYEDRDIDVLEALLAPDYVFDFRAYGTTWGREQDLESARNMFASPEVRGIEMSFDGEPVVTPGEAPDTWILQVPMSHLVVHDEKQGPQDYHADAGPLEFHVRRVAEPQPHLVLVRWVDLRKE